MNQIFIIAQICGFLALISAIISIPQKTKNRYIIFYILQNLFSLIQYFLLEAYIAFCLCLLCVLRLVVYAYLYKYSKKTKIFILVFFIIFNILISILSFNYFYDIFPMIASIIVCYTVWQTRLFIIRLGCIVCKVLWGIYSLICMAYFAVVMDIIMIIWTLYIIYKQRYNIKEN